jgi:hypothetical protein
MTVWCLKLWLALEQASHRPDGDGEMEGLVALPCERRGLSSHVISKKRIRPGGLSPRFANLTVYLVSVGLYLEYVAF